MIPPATARVMAGVPALNHSFYRRIRFSVGDPAALIELPPESGDGAQQSILILRDIELQRARRHARVDRVHCPADFTPDNGLSGDRETATAQALAECLRRHAVRRVIADRTLPLLFAHQMQQAGLTVVCDPDWGVMERRQKDEQEVVWLEQAQAVTEQAVAMACETVARATADRDGILRWEGQVLTAEHLRERIDLWLLRRGYQNPVSIVAGGPPGADCHDHGSGPLQTGQPIIIDVFPRNRQTLYHGDCTRTVVHGQIPDQVMRMHQAVVSAKRAAIAACRAGVTGQAVHEAAVADLVARGYTTGLPTEDSPSDSCAMTHGTGHGIGLDVHEPPLLDRGGPELVAGDCLTVEPGLYCRTIGGVRVEDMVVVYPHDCVNLNSIHEGLEWK
jgi:Xaa-Pro aminopeptidase